ncbi:hypothetical protein P153DRAFT_396318 [Dothidotthia symphoricarpi CBS 119687]|uniref:Uncharacterized protein n=1 Tax=Dothidotthia symphoricarpi CBS 119687 TaxID=1392245 RepID=A0A6A6ADX2_9PLEO|nr:uncharacterized protein P153DRAFT_396318 [Dothidotthia symphoricarpi CBS 119687]KAF2129980.1 hypothetical protein P153DRAFT_396318 [Dothidotthia symphoricarpi CBS 119687]
MNEPTLTLQIPFILLGRKDLELWGPEDQHTRPLRTVYDALVQFCPDVPVRSWAPDDTFSAEPHSTTDNDSPTDSERARTHEKHLADWSTLENGSAWVLRRAPTTTNLDHEPRGVNIGVLPGWRDGDARLDFDEKARLGGKVWSCALLLQRFNIPLHTSTATFRAFATQTQKLCSALHVLGTWSGPAPRGSGACRWFSVVTTSTCWMNVSAVSRGVETARSRQHYRDVHANPGFEITVLRKLLVVLAAFEAPLAMLSTPTAQLAFWPLSRFLEYRRIRALGREKAGLWRGLAGRKHLTDCRRDDMHRQDKSAWVGDLGAAEEASLRTRGRERTAWDVIVDADGMQIEQLVGEMTRFEDRGRRLGVGFWSATRERTVSSISFASRQSTLDFEEIVAYTSLIAAMLFLAHTVSCDELIARIERFHARGCAPLDGLGDLLSAVLEVPESAKSFWMEYLSPYYTASSAVMNPKNPPVNPAQRPLRNDPFAPLESYIHTTLANELEYMPTFIHRYARAGGFAPTPGIKAYCLLLAEERARERKDGRNRRAKGCLGDVKEARVRDAAGCILPTEESEEERRDRVGKEKDSGEEVRRWVVEQGSQGVLL